MNIKKEREAFEKHASKFFTDSKEAFKTNGDQYLYDEVIWMWDCWIERAKAQAVLEWISVNDQLPPSDEMVLICWSDSPDIEPEKDFMDICVDTGCPFWANSLNDEPSHWMPLPKAQEPAND